jgi:hypothetical protein
MKTISESRLGASGGSSAPSSACSAHACHELYGKWRNGPSTPPMIAWLRSSSSRRSIRTKPGSFNRRRSSAGLIAASTYL